MNKILSAAAALVAVNSATAAVKLSGIFSDDMVLQRGKPVPVAVRYAFRANPMGDCNLYNKEGLPASPFRTDDW